ncbi:MAG: prepilin-type N-terminal cleavage/methylation domain-containing protein [Magnetococcus sp. DMHC-1]
MNTSLFANGQVLRKKQGGFSLVELMVVVAIIAVLASIGIPSMIGFVRSAESTEAVENSARIVKLIEAYVTARPAEGAAVLAAAVTGRIVSKNAANNTLRAAIPEAVMGPEALFVYRTVVVIDPVTRVVNTCIRADKLASKDVAEVILASAAGPTQFIYYSGMTVTGNASWEGNVFRGTYTDPGSVEPAGLFVTVPAGPIGAGSCAGAIAQSANSVAG